LANHLCEYNGLFSEEKCYPKKEIRKFLIKSYLEGVKNYENEDLRLVDMYSLISHYQWGCWGIIMHNSGNTKFDYTKYTNYRFDLFNQYYPQFFS
jgi:hypothetical protein